MLLVIFYDLPIENVGFFTAFRMTRQGDSFVENAGLFTAFRMTNEGGICSLRTRDSSFNVILNELLGRGRIPTAVAWV